VRTSAILQYRKDPRFILAVSILIFLATTAVYYLIQQASEISPEALSNRMVLFVLWNINLILILGILFVLIRTAIKLFLERQRGIHGSRFRTKLVLTYMATSLVPIILLFIIANDLLRVSVDRWFNMPVQRVLENSEAIAQEFQDRALSQAAGAAEEIAATAAPGTMDEILKHIHGFHRVDVVGVYENGVIVQLIADPRSPIQLVRDPSISFFAEVDKEGFAEKIDLVAGGKWLRHARAIEGQPGRAALAGVFVPDRINRLIDESIVAHRNFQQLDMQRSSVKASQTSMFLTVTLYILFGTLWISVFVSRRITGPIRALAEGTRTLAEGNYEHRIEVKATDEFGVLIESFNTMADELGTKRTALTRSNEELKDLNERLDEERETLSTVLSSVSTGIIAFDQNRDLISINPSALRMLEIEEPPAGTPLHGFLRGHLHPLADCVAEIEKGSLRPGEVTIIRGGELRYLEVLGARLGEAATNGGWVVALEDTTQLVQAQKLAAWSEAARRIAHEIRNPLTPIQLSAERIARKYVSADPDLSDAVSVETRTIVDEVTRLKRMVDEFSRFARMPAIHLEESDVGAILTDVTRLYNDVREDVVVELDAPGSLRAVVDPEQIRRAMINLLDNAMAATAEGRIILTATRSERALSIRVSDTGRGVADADKDKLFLPYFSTKGEGTGLGLAIVHRIVHDHDGRISVHDNEPQGTTFEIEIPV